MRSTHPPHSSPGDVSGLQLIPILFLFPGANPPHFVVLPRRITKKSAKYFFDRDKVAWVEWEKGAEVFAEVAGEEAVNPAKTKQHFPTTKSRVFSAVD